MDNSLTKIPLISVVLPVCNAEAYISEALDSIFAQTFKDFEIIAVNDGSTDNSFQILEDYAARDKRIVPHHLQSTGLVGALNYGIKVARGHYVARMDGDDVCHPTRFERQITFLTNNPDIAFLGTQIDILDGDGKAVSRSHFPVDCADVNTALLQGFCPFCHPTMMIRREALLALGGYNSVFQTAEDLELWQRASLKFRLANLDEVLFSYRRHDQSVSTTKHRQQIFTHAFAHFCLQQRLAGKQDPSEYMDNAFSINALPDGELKQTLQQLRDGSEIYYDNLNKSHKDLALNESEITRVLHFIRAWRFLAPKPFFSAKENTAFLTQLLFHAKSKHFNHQIGPIKDLLKTIDKSRYRKSALTRNLILWSILVKSWRS